MTIADIDDWLNADCFIFSEPDDHTVIRVAHTTAPVSCTALDDRIEARFGRMDIDAGLGDDVVSTSFGEFDVDGGAGDDRLALRFGTGALAGGEGPMFWSPPMRTSRCPVVQETISSLPGLPAASSMAGRVTTRFP